MWDKIVEYIRYVWDSYDKAPMLVELLLIGFAVYSIIRFLRGTGGEKLFKGIGFLLLGIWAIGLLSQRVGLELDRIQLLFKYFLVSVLVVGAVAFQPELRRGLMRLGETRFSRTAVPQMQQVIEQIIDAVAFLSRSEIGALIALEREVPLGDLIAGGTRIDARVSADLLNTIFWPGSPLHDMGVIIQGRRLAAAGVQFPLAEHGEYDRLLGSRHRAAIGLSKETDAVVVVVSEETGHIGLASDGKLARMLTLEQLRLQLLDTMVPATKRKPTAPPPSSLTKISPKMDKKALENLPEAPEDMDKE
ncbi:MAG: diadenylate cyclase CdaA [Sedimentisphaerales bacterium]|nr:diadenylate cyclase CdaA [Sedimentisphaerales bacterium]